MARHPQTARMGDVSMREQVARYLHRLRFTLPFPCNRDEMYFGLVPLEVMHWKDRGMFDANCDVPPSRASNFLSTLHTHLMSVDSAVLHVSADSMDHYLEATHGSRGFESVLWFRPPLNVPVPHNSMSSPFFLNIDHPFYAEIMVWLDKALLLEEEIQSATKIVEMYSKLASTHTQVHHTWPELLNFIRLRHMVSVPSPSIAGRLKTTVERVMKNHDKAGIIEMLATAVMLPEKIPILPAWVNFYTGEQHE
jgi:hypothetical protein